MTDKICTKCGETNKLFRYRWHNQNQKYLFVSRCYDCEKSYTKQHQENNREYWRELNRSSYRRWTSEFREQRNLQSSLRHNRIKRVHFKDELSELVAEEAYRLSKLREKTTGFKWHVDHIIPLNGKNISGLHTWNNLAVIPASINLSKGNKEKTNRPT
jgi:hypothetical protein